MTRKIKAAVSFAFALFGVGFSAAQTPSGFVPIAGTRIYSNGTLVSGVTLCAQPVTSAGLPIALQVGGIGGHTVDQPICFNVTNGAFSGYLPDTSKSTPLNACFRVTVKTSNGMLILSRGYECVQPTSASGSIWCDPANGCNFDLFPPNLAPLALSQQGPQGPTGPPGCAVGTTCIGVVALSSATTQKVTQAPGTVFSANDLATSSTPTVDIRAYGAISGASDVTLAVQGAVNFATSIGGVVYIPPGQWNLNGAIQSSCDAIICIPAISTSGPAAQVKIVGSSRVRQDAAGAPSSGGSSVGTVITTTTNGVDTNSAIFGVPNVSGNGFGGLDNTDVYFSDFTCRVSPNPSIGCVNAFNSSGASIEHVRAETGELYNDPHTQPTNIVAAFQLPQVNNDTLSKLEWSQASGFYRGVVASEHAHFEGDWVAFGVQGLYITPGYYPISGKFGTEEVAQPIVVSGPMTIDLTLGIELNPSNGFPCSAWCYSATDIYDPSSNLHGLIRYTKVQSGVGNVTAPLVVSGGGLNLTTYNEYTQTWTNNAARRTQFSVGSGPTNADGLKPGTSVQVGDADLVLGNWDSPTPGRTNAGVMQMYNAGSTALGTSHYSLFVQPFGGDLTLGNGGGLTHINGANVDVNGIGLCLSSGAGCSGVTTGFTGTKSGSCTFSITNGLITGVSGC